MTTRLVSMCGERSLIPMRTRGRGQPALYVGLLGVLILDNGAARAEAPEPSTRPPQAAGSKVPVEGNALSARAPREVQRPEALAAPLPSRDPASAAPPESKEDGSGFSAAVLTGFGYARGVSSQWLGGFFETRFGAAWNDYRVKLWLGPRLYAGQSLPGLTFLQPSLIFGMGYQIAPHVQLGLDLGLVNPWILQRATTRQLQAFWYTTEISPHLLLFFSQNRRLSGPALSLRPGLDLNYGGKATPRVEAGFRLLVGVSYVH